TSTNTPVSTATTTRTPTNTPIASATRTRTATNTAVASATGTRTATRTATRTPGAATSTPSGNDDSDGDECRDNDEQGSDEHRGGDRDASNPWDFFDVPAPRHDPQASGAKNRAVSIADVVGVVYYIGTSHGGTPNVNNVGYDSTKDGDWFDG